MNDPFHDWSETWHCTACGIGHYSIDACLRCVPSTADGPDQDVPADQMETEEF